LPQCWSGADFSTRSQGPNRGTAEEFGLTKVRSNRGDLLSGGERRRTEIARCLASDPKFILLDEPFAGVDPIAVEDIQAIVARLADERGIGVLITDHNVHETLAITDRTYLMFEGSIIKSGTAEELASDEVCAGFTSAKTLFFAAVGGAPKAVVNSPSKAFFGGHFNP
jgi:ABC-type (unclassified) transport system, ATPase component